MTQKYTVFSKTVEHSSLSLIKFVQILEGSNYLTSPYQLVVFKPLSYCFKETKGFAK